MMLQFGHGDGLLCNLLTSESVDWQSWGLLELQRGNMHAAVRLLERCVLQDPSCSPVLKWKAVQLAQQVVLSRRQRLAMRTANFV